MKQLESPTDWLEARKVKTRDRDETRPPNLFGGQSLIETTQIQSVEVLKITVSPSKDVPSPRSYAVENSPDINWESLKWQKSQDSFEKSAKTQSSWNISEYAALPLDFEWQQSSESRWNFYFSLPTGARCLGLGERISGLNLRGRVHTLFNYSDNLHLPNVDPMYKSIPFLIVESSCSKSENDTELDNGSKNEPKTYWGIFLDSPARQRWSLDVELTQQGSIELLSRRGWTAYLFGPSSLPDLLAAYTSLTGRTQLPPDWSLGHQQSRWSYPDQETALSIADEFRKRRIPCDTIVLDIDYMDEYRIFTNSNERFPQFREMTERLAADGFKVVTIVDPGIKKDAKYFVYKDGCKSDYFCKKADGKPFYAKIWPGQSVLPDFLRQDVRNWWSAFHGFYIENGVAGIWNDMNEPCILGQSCPLPVEAIELPRENHQLFVQQSEEGRVGHFEVRNVYGHLMSQSSYEGLRALRPDERPFVLTRSAYAGSQKYAAIWLGDNMSWWEHLEWSIPMLLNTGLSGMPFCGVDIGGFGGDCTPELLARWYALGMFYPFFRNHCSKEGISQEPWAFGPEVESCIKHFIESRYRLLPYIKALFWEHWRNGAPLMRPMSWGFPSDSQACELDDQFMFGPDILVAPILKRGRSIRNVYFPKGNWYPFDGGKPISGSSSRMIELGLSTVPAFIREGAIIPYTEPIQNTGEFEKASVSFRCYGDSAIGLYIEDDGISNEYANNGYNEWLLRFEDGELQASVSNYEYIAPERSYFIEHGERRTPFTLPRS